MAVHSLSLLIPIYALLLPYLNFNIFPPPTPPGVVMCKGWRKRKGLAHAALADTGGPV